MDATQAKIIRDLEFPEVEPTITVEDLGDLSNRTLLYGYTLERDSFHVYLEDGEIHRLIYRGTIFETAEVVEHSQGESMEAYLLAPSKRAYPQWTDYNFATMLLSKQVSPNLTTYSEPNQANLEYKEQFEEFNAMTLTQIKAAQA